MVYPVDNPDDQAYVPTKPFDSSDPPRYGQLEETVKDAFKQEFTQFFTLEASADDSKIVEIPTVEKYAIGDDPASSQNLETFVNLIMSYADTPDRLPMVAITSASVREKRLGLGTNNVGIMQYSPSITGSETGTFNIQNGWRITLVTWPLGVETREGSDVTQASTIEFVDGFFADPTQATIAEVVKAINIQALYYTAHASSTGALILEAGGLLAPGNPNYIEVTGGDSACLSALGLTLGQSDIYTNPDNPPKNRRYMSADMTINIDVISDDLNTKQELADLVYSYFTYYLERRYFQLLGRSYFERGLDPEEWFHIILNGQFSWSGEVSIPRPGQEGYDRIYSARGSLPVTIIDYLDKRLVQPPVFASQASLLDGSAFPEGDHGDAISYLGRFRR